MSGSAAKRAKERLIFQVFLETVPSYPGSFGGDLFCVDSPDQDPPDVLCVSRGGVTIGVELREWLDESQIARRKNFERSEEAIRRAIRPEPKNIYTHIAHVWLYPRYTAALRSSDMSGFQAELLSLLAQVDGSWQTLDDWDKAGRFTVGDFTPYGGLPILSRHLDGLDVFWLGPNKPRRDIHWFAFRNWGGAYSPDWMVNALRQGIEDKVVKYVDRPLLCPMSEFHLLLYYDQALLYNTPVESPFRGFGDVATIARQAVQNRTLPFHEIHLLNATGEPQAWRIF